MRRIYHDIPSKRYKSLNPSHFKKINDLAVDVNIYTYLIIYKIL